MPLATAADVVAARRILVYGVSGAGKSTLAKQLGEALALSVHLVDDEIGWLPGWVERPVGEQRAIASVLAAEDAWVLDSAYGKWIDMVWERTEVVVALDYPRWLSLGRLLLRSVARASDRRPICNGNTESFRQLFSRDSLILWHFRSFPRKRARMRAWAAASAGPKVFLAHRPRDVEHLLDSAR